MHWASSLSLSPCVLPSSASLTHQRSIAIAVSVYKLCKMWNHENCSPYRVHLTIHRLIIVADLGKDRPEQSNESDSATGISRVTEIIRTTRLIRTTRISRVTRFANKKHRLHRLRHRDNGEPFSSAEQNDLPPVGWVQSISFFFIQHDRQSVN